MAFLSTPPSRVATCWLVLAEWEEVFLSTPPSRVATMWEYNYDHTEASFYPRHPRGWRHCYPQRVRSAQQVSIHATLAGGDCHDVSKPAQCVSVSIHATLAGGDTTLNGSPPLFWSFYPRHPRGWRRMSTMYYTGCWYVSIHATLAGGDRIQDSTLREIRCFYPRHPRGWRRVLLHIRLNSLTVSIHATLAGGDRCPVS